MTDDYVGELDGMDLHACVRSLQELKGGLGRRALTIKTEEGNRKQAHRALARRRARVRADTSGTVSAKDDAATLDPECQKLEDAYDIAETRENYAKNMARSDATDVSNVQTQARLIEQQLRLAGTPDRRVS